MKTTHELLEERIKAEFLQVRMINEAIAVEMEKPLYHRSDRLLNFLSTEYAVHVYALAAFQSMSA